MLECALRSTGNPRKVSIPTLLNDYSTFKTNWKFGHGLFIIAVKGIS